MTIRNIFKRKETFLPSVFKEGQIKNYYLKNRFLMIKHIQLDKYFITS